MHVEAGQALTFDAYFRDRYGSPVNSLLTVTVNIIAPDGTIPISNVSCAYLAGSKGCYRYTYNGATTSPGLWKAEFDAGTDDVSDRYPVASWIVGSSWVQHVVEDTVLDAQIADHNIAGSVGASLDANNAVANPLLSLVPGNYPKGTAGYALGLIGTGKGIVISPVAPDGEVRIYQFTDYNVGESMELRWTNDGTWPDLTGATISFVVEQRIDKTPIKLTASGNTTNPASESSQVYVNLTGAQTGTLEPGYRGYQYWLWATLANGRKLVLANAYVTVYKVSV